MIIDTSALIAVLRDEPEADRVRRALSSATDVSLSAATYLEASIVVDANRDPVLTRRFDDLLQEIGADIVAVTKEQVLVARAAYRDFGKGSGHAARLNFGDCFSYALAKESGEPILFVGNDFDQTDLVPVLDQ